MAGHFYSLPPTFIGGRQPYAPRLGQVQSEPAPSAPPPINRVHLRIVEAHYREEPNTTVFLTSIAPLLQTPAVADNPPPRSFATQRSIIGQWEPRRLPLPRSRLIAPLLPAAATPDNPPRISYANRNLIHASWITPYRLLPKRTLSVTEFVSDTTPDAFSFTDQSGVQTSTLITSAPVTITGINAPANISITGGEYSIDGGAWTSSPGTISNNQQVSVRHTSSASYSTATNTALTVGGVSDTFTSTTEDTPAGGSGGNFIYLRRRLRT